MRQVYAWLLGLHPRRFRQRFAEEMLWVFDCAAAEGRGAGPLLADAAVSLARQWVCRNNNGETQAAGAPRWEDLRVPAFYCAPTDGPAPGPRAAGYVVSLIVMAGLFLLMGKDGQRIAGIVIGTVTPFHLLEVRTGDGAVNLTTKVRVKPRKEVPKSGLLWEYFQGMPVLLAIDRDRDLTISREEMAAAPEALRGLDKNRDGKLSPEECGFGAGPPARLPADVLARARVWFMRVNPVLAAMDTDGNGELSKVEISTAAAALRAMDWNSNGVLTGEELLPDRITSEVAKMMTRLDTNTDGRIAKEEIPLDVTEEARNLLRRADRDRDGVVTEQELRNELRRMGEAGGSAPGTITRSRANPRD